jgi:hypothetical protein
MSVPQYIDLRKQRHQQQMKSLQIGKQVNSTISRKLHNFDNGIEEDLDESRDDRSNYERNEDLNTIRQQIGAKLNTLFANDHDEVNTFMEYINQSQISIQDFNAVYPNLLKDSDPNTNTASYSIPKFQQLLDNDNATGSTNQSSLMKDVYDLVKTVYESGKLNMTEEIADDVVDRLEASIQSTPSSSEKNKKAKDIMSSDKSEEDIVLELATLFKTPLRKTNKKEEQKQQEDEVFNPKKPDKIRPPFSSKKVKKLKKTELQILAQEYGLETDGLKEDLVSRLMELNAKK